MDIEEFEWDESNEDHLAVRGFTRVRLSAVLDGDYVVLRNHRGASGDYKIVGRDNGGLLVTIVVTQTHKRGVWRPITAWPSGPSEERHAERHGI